MFLLAIVLTGGAVGRAVESPILAPKWLLSVGLWEVLLLVAYVGVPFVTYRSQNHPRWKPVGEAHAERHEPRGCVAGRADRGRWNVIARLSFYGSPVFFGLVGVAAMLFVRSPYWSGQNLPVEQPVPFSHEVHCGKFKLDCRSCHAGSERDAFAGMPSTEVCMNCHTHVWKGLAALEPVRSSLETGVPLVWLRVHDLPDHAHFHHAMHTQKGIGCTDCHGRVDQMHRVWQTESLHMEWCLNCHRQPERFVRPKDEAFNMEWQRPPDQRERGHEPLTEYRIERKTDCSTCHR